MERHWYLSRSWRPNARQIWEIRHSIEQDICVQFHGFYSVSQRDNDPRLDISRKSHRDWRACAPSPNRESSLAEYLHCPCHESVGPGQERGYESTLQSECLSPKTLHKTTKLIPDEPSKCSPTLSELTLCLAMDFRRVFIWTKKRITGCTGFELTAQHWNKSPEKISIHFCMSGYHGM